MLVIAHRLSTAERADLVGVVDDGQILELGTHTELLARGGRYTALFDTWSRGLATAGCSLAATGNWQPSGTISHLSAASHARALAIDPPKVQVERVVPMAVGEIGWRSACPQE